jgi:hypothetical protein
MATWYQAAIRYQKEDEAGSLQTINEVYLIDSISFTDAEARAYKQIVTGASDFSVTSIARLRLADLFAYEDGEQWFKTKVIYFSADEKTGKDKRIVNQILVNATGIDQALDRIKEGMKNWLIPYEVEGISLTKILDVFPYSSEEEEDPQIPENFTPVEK